MDNILVMAIVNFITQVAFIWTRTLNVKAVAGNMMKEALMTGALVHITWLISISLSTYSVVALISDWQWQYIPVPIASLIGGLIGTYFGLKEKQRYRLGIPKRDWLKTTLKFWKQ